MALVLVTAANFNKSKVRGVAPRPTAAPSDAHERRPLPGREEPGPRPPRNLPAPGRHQLPERADLLVDPGAAAEQTDLAGVEPAVLGEEGVSVDYGGGDGYGVPGGGYCGGAARGEGGLADHDDLLHRPPPGVAPAAAASSSLGVSRRHEVG
ncbi:hypothetical protein THAOC_05458, partial [Thalassiosira oceanica]